MNTIAARLSTIPVLDELGVLCIVVVFVGAIRGV